MLTPGSRVGHYRIAGKLGETMMKLELVEGLLERRWYGDELRRLLKSRRG